MAEKDRFVSRRRPVDLIMEAPELVMILESLWLKPLKVKLLLLFDWAWDEIGDTQRRKAMEIILHTRRAIILLIKTFPLFVL